MGLWGLFGAFAAPMAATAAGGSVAYGPLILRERRLPSVRKCAIGRNLTEIKALVPTLEQAGLGNVTRFLVGASTLSPVGP